MCTAWKHIDGHADADHGAESWMLNADACAACMHRQTPQVHNQLCTPVRVEALQRDAIAQAYTVASTVYWLSIIDNPIVLPHHPICCRRLWKPVVYSLYYVYQLKWSRTFRGNVRRLHISTKRFCSSKVFLFEDENPTRYYYIYNYDTHVKKLCNITSRLSSLNLECWKKDYPHIFWRRWNFLTVAQPNMNVQMSSI